MNVEILKELLKIESAECTICEKGEKILEEFEYYDLGEYDMILMDVQMPVMNGYEATGHIRALENPALAQIPIFAMTANAFDEDRRTALSCGMNGFLSKPIVIEELTHTLQNIFGNEGI